jgi:molecular chaperone GrpE (heat shock protein)
MKIRKQKGRKREGRGDVFHDSDGGTKMKETVQDTSDLTKQLIDTQTEVLQKIANQESQQTIVMQQLRELSLNVYTNSSQLQAATQNLQQEIGKLQTGGPQRAMAGLFFKLFRELVEHVNRLDDILNLDGSNDQNVEHDGHWRRAVETLRAHLEGILASWGVKPVFPDVGKELFDPEKHEAVPAEEGEVTEEIPPNIIIHVRRRGWQLQEQILQFPQVVVS